MHTNKNLQEKIMKEMNDKKVGQKWIGEDLKKLVETVRADQCK